MEARDSVSERGYSLIEIMIILVITAVLVTFVVARFGNAKAQFGRQNISRELKVNLERARFDSVKRRPTLADGSDKAEVKILNASSFSVKIDMNQDGTLVGATETKTVDFTASDVRIVGSGGALVYPITIRFDRYGRIEAKDNSATPQNITPIFTVCGGKCTTDANVNAANADVIYVSPSGTVAMLNGGESKPSFAAPNVSVVIADTTINDDLRVTSTNSSY